MSDLFLKLREYKKKHAALQNFCSQHIEKILEQLPVRILKSDGDLNELFAGLAGSNNLEYKVKVVDIVLRVLRKDSTSASHCGNIISRICFELPRLPSTAVVRWCDESVESIINDTDVNMIWRDILPECLNAISSLDTLNGGSSAADYRAQVLQKLLQCQWKDSQLVQLTTMFKDLRLSKQKHREFVIKVCSYIRDMAPDSLFPLLHQLLKLCKAYNVEVVLAHLSNYFNLRLYSKLATLSQDSQATTMEIDDIEEFSVSELHICLSTCIYQVTDVAEPEAVRRQLKAWPRSQLAREPFLINVALAMTEKGMEFKGVCIDATRLAIEQAVMDETRKRESAWMRRVLPSDLDIDETLKELATGGGNHSSSTWGGLIELCLALLGGAAAARGAAALAHLARARACTVPRTLAALADRLAADSANEHCVECLRLLCKSAPLSVQSSTQLGSILEGVRPTPGAEGVFAAVHPLLNYSERIRDTLVMTCRKGLYSRDSAHRCLAAAGILTVLKHLKISAVAATSTQEDDQFESQCSQSYLSQLTVDVHASQMGVSVTSRVTKETICHEMVSILRRCLGQDAAVKQLLYTRWYSCIKDKPSLHGSVLEMLYEHLSQYLPEDGETTLLIDKCVTSGPSNPVLVEPIGYLLYLIAQLLQSPAIDVESILASQREEANLPRSKLKKILDDLSETNLLAQIDIENLRVSDATPEARVTCARVQQLLHAHEALAAHQLWQWRVDCGRAEPLYALYKGYTQLIDNTKSPTKLGKKNNKLNETTDSFKSRRSQSSQKSQRAAKGREGTRKTPKAGKDKNAPFKPLPCLWDLKLCYRILDLLYSADVPWSSAEARAALRGRGPVYGWAARAVTSSLRRAHEQAHVYAHAPRLAALLYERCLCRFQDLFDFDAEAALGCMEMLEACLELLCTPRYKCDVASYLSKITGDNRSSAANKATLLSRARAALLVSEHALAQDDSTLNRRVVRAAADVVVAALRIPTELHLVLSKEISKLEGHVRETGHECVSLVAQLLAAAAADSCETQLLDDVLARLADKAPASESSQTSQQEPVQFPWLAAGARAAVRAHVCAHLLVRFNWAKHTSARARDLALALPLAVPTARVALEGELLKVRASCVLQLCQLARALRALCACVTAGVDAGGDADAVVGADAGGGAAVRAARDAAAFAVRLYALAGNLLRTMDTETASEAGVEGLVQQMGDRLAVALGAAAARLDGKRAPRLVHAAESFRASVYRLDRRGQCGYRQYVSKRVGSVGMRIRTDDGAPASDAEAEAEPMDDTRDTAPDEDMEAPDSDADTVILESVQEHYKHI